MSKYLAFLISFLPSSDPSSQQAGSDAVEAEAAGAAAVVVPAEASEVVSEVNYCYEHYTIVRADGA